MLGQPGILNLITPGSVNIGQTESQRPCITIIMYMIGMRHILYAVKTSCVLWCLCYPSNKSDFRLSTANDISLIANPVYLLFSLFMLYKMWNLWCVIKIDVEVWIHTKIKLHNKTALISSIVACWKFPGLHSLYIFGIS